MEFDTEDINCFCLGRLKSLSYFKGLTYWLSEARLQRICNTTTKGLSWCLISLHKYIWQFTTFISIKCKDIRGKYCALICSILTYYQNQNNNFYTFVLHIFTGWLQPNIFFSVNPITPGRPANDFKPTWSVNPKPTDKRGSKMFKNNSKITKIGPQIFKIRQIDPKIVTEKS